MTAPRLAEAPRRRAYRDALLGAAKAALLAVGLAVPILAYRTDTDLAQQLVLSSRWPLVLRLVAAVFVARFLCLTLGPRLARLAAKASADTMRSAPRFSRIAAGFAWIMGLGTLLAFPFLALLAVGPAGSLKWIDNFGIQILLYVMLGLGLDIVVGLAGLLDLGYVAFYAVGAYSYALLSTHWGLSIWACLPIAGLLAALWGLLLGVPVLRLRGDYLALVTLAFGEIIRMVLVNWTDLTNGEAGIGSIPRVTFFGWPFVAGPSGFAAHLGIAFSPIHRVVFLFYLVLGFVFLTYGLTLALRRLPIGRAFEALREDEIACRALGVDTVKVKLMAFALGALVAGVAGALFAARQGFVSPSSFTFIESATILSIVVLGGRGSRLGVALAAVFLVGGSELLRELETSRHAFGSSFDPTQYRLLILGLAMVVVMNWRPEGLIARRRPTILLAALGPGARATSKAG